MNRPLTDTQRELLNLACADVPDKAAAGILELSYGAVRWNWAQIFAKLGVKTRSGAVARHLTLSLVVAQSDPV